MGEKQDLERLIAFEERSRAANDNPPHPKSKLKVIIDNQVRFARSLLLKENIPYFVADSTAFLVGYGSLFAFSFSAEDLGVSNAYNALITFGIKSSMGYAIHRITYTAGMLAMGYKDRLAQNRKKYNRTHGWGISIGGTLKLGGHYLLLETGILPKEISFLAIYAPASLIGFLTKETRAITNGALTRKDYQANL